MMLVHTYIRMYIATSSVLLLLSPVPAPHWRQLCGPSEGTQASTRPDMWVVWCLCMRACVRLCMWICVVHTYIHTCVSLWACVCACVSTYVLTCVHTYLQCMYVRRCVFVNFVACIAFILYKHVHMYIRMYMHMYMYRVLQNGYREFHSTHDSPLTLL